MNNNPIDATNEKIIVSCTKTLKSLIDATLVVTELMCSYSMRHGSTLRDRSAAIILLACIKQMLKDHPEFSDKGAIEIIKEAEENLEKTRPVGYTEPEEDQQEKMPEEEFVEDIPGKKYYDKIRIVDGDFITFIDPVIIFDNGNSAFIKEDNCYVLVTKTNGSIFYKSYYISDEARKVLANINENKDSENVKDEYIWKIISIEESRPIKTLRDVCGNIISSEPDNGAYTGRVVLESKVGEKLTLEVVKPIVQEKSRW